MCKVPSRIVITGFVKVRRTNYATLHLSLFFSLFVCPLQQLFLRISLLLIFFFCHLWISYHFIKCVLINRVESYKGWSSLTPVITKAGIISKSLFKKVENCQPQNQLWQISGRATPSLLLLLTWPLNFIRINKSPYIIK